MNIDFTNDIIKSKEQDTLDKPFPIQADTKTGQGFGIYTKNRNDEIVRLSFLEREDVEAFMTERGYEWGPEKNRLTHYANERILLQVYPVLKDAKHLSAADPQWNIPEGEVKLDYDGTSTRTMEDSPSAVELREVDHPIGETKAAEDKKNGKKNGKKLPPWLNKKKNGKKNGKKEDKKNGEKDDDSKDDKDKNGKKLPPWLNKKKSKGRDYSELYKKVKGKYDGDIKVGDSVKNTNKECTHFQSEGTVKKINHIPQDKGVTIAYECTNAGKTWKEGDMLEKTPDQLMKGNCRSGKCVY